jgi:hypothetical protein
VEEPDKITVGALDDDPLFSCGFFGFKQYIIDYQHYGLDTAALYL